MTEETPAQLLTLTAEIVASHVANNSVAAGELAHLIAEVHGALSALGAAPPEPAAADPKPAVPVRSSIKQDHIVCLEDGKKLKMLRRYLMTRFGMSPDQYRAKWKLPADYPMVAPDYAERRRALAKSFGLGRRRAAPPPPQPPVPARRGRKPKAAA